MPLVDVDLTTIEDALHSERTSVVLADGTSVEVEIKRPKANGGVGVRSLAAMSVVTGERIQFNAHDCGKRTKFTDLAQAGHRVTWVLSGTFPHRAAVTMVDGVLTKPMSAFPAAKVTPLPETATVGEAATTCTTPEALTIHDALHGTCVAVEVGGVKLHISKKGKGHERSVFFRGVTFRQQSPNATACGKQVRDTGCTMTWVQAPGVWGQIVDGVVRRPCAFIVDDGVAAEPPTKKVKKRADTVALPGEAVAASLVPPAEAALRDLDKDQEEFWKLEEVLAANIHGRNEDYNASLLSKKMKPLSFVLAAAQGVTNPTLAALFGRRLEAISLERSKKDARERHAFHGAHPSKLKSICDTGLLPFGHPLNTSAKPVDDGYFGSCRKGVYVSRYADYTLKYANRLVPLRAGERCRIVLFRCIPGCSKHIEELSGPIDPTPGFDSHSSPQFLEWFLFHADQCCPTHILTIEAREDTRTASDDK